MDRNCCTEASACQVDSSCNTAFDCLARCADDGACRARCAQFYNRDDALLQVNTCREKSCSTECGLSCGGFGYSVPGCDSCIRSTCCDLATACARNDDCQRLDLCQTNCLAGSTSCSADCEAQFPNGTNAYGPWLDCVQNACASSCQSGGNWACLDGSVLWPKPRTLGPLTFSVTVADLQTEKPYAHAHVRACAKIDVECSSPLDESDTDATGLVSLTVPTGSGFEGYLEITGGDNGNGKDNMPSPIYPAMWYPVPPVIAQGWRGRIQFISQADLPLLALFTTVDIDPTRGHFAANAVDCNFTIAGGVSFSADSIEADPGDKAIKTFYFVGGLPNIHAAATEPGTGIGGFVNLPAHGTVVTATATTADNKKLGSLSINIRAGWFTTTSFPPTPH